MRTGRRRHSRRKSRRDKEGALDPAASLSEAQDGVERGGGHEYERAKGGIVRRQIQKPLALHKGMDAVHAPHEGRAPERKRRCSKCACRMPVTARKPP